MVSYIGLFAGLSLMVLPGSFIYLLATSRKKTTLSELVAFGFGLSVVYLLFASYILQLIYKIDPYLLLLPLLPLAFFATRKGVKIERDRWFFPLLFMFLVNFSLKFVYTYQLQLQPGIDAPYHTLVTMLISEQQSFPNSLLPYSPVSLNYTPGLHTMSAIIFMLSNIKIWWAPPLVTAIVTAAGAFFVFALVSRIAKSEIAIFSAFSYSFLALTPYSLFSAAGSYPHPTAASFTIFGFLSFIILRNKKKYGAILFSLSAASIILLHSHTAIEFFIVITTLSVLEFAISKKADTLKPILYLGIATLLIGFWLFPAIYRMYLASKLGYGGLYFPWPVPLVSYLTYFGLAAPFAVLAALNKRKLEKNKLLWTWFFVLFLLSFAYVLPVLQKFITSGKALANAVIPASIIAGAGIHSTWSWFKKARTRKLFLITLFIFSVTVIYLLNENKTTLNKWIDRNDINVLFKVEDLVPPNCKVIDEAPGGLWIPAIAKRVVTHSPISGTDEPHNPDVNYLENLTYTLADTRSNVVLYQKAIDSGFFYIYRKNLYDDPYLSEVYKYGNVALYRIKGAPSDCK